MGRPTGMASLGEWELLSLHSNPEVLLQTEPVEMRYLEWNTHYRKRGEGGDLGLRLPILTPSPLT